MTSEKMVIGKTYADGPSTREGRELFVYRGFREYDGMECIVMDPIGDTVYHREDDGVCLFVKEMSLFFRVVEEEL